MLKGRCSKSFQSLKGGGEKFYPVLGGGGTEGLGLAIFPFCSPPPQSLNNFCEGIIEGFKYKSIINVSALLQPRDVTAVVNI